MIIHLHNIDYVLNYYEFCEKNKDLLKTFLNTYRFKMGCYHVWTFTEHSQLSFLITTNLCNKKKRF